MKKNERVSKMQEEVWRMKEDVYRQTKGMRAKEYFRYIQKQARKYSAGRRAAGKV